MKPSIATITLNPAVDQTVSIPNFRAGEVNRVEWEQSDPGGKGVNVASFLADFGCSVSVSGFLGKDNAELFQTFFAQQGIQNRFVPVAGKTRVNIKITDTLLNQVTDINFPGQPPIAADLATLHRVIDDLAIAHDWFVLAGSLPHGLSPAIYGELVARLKAQGKTVVLDASGESFRQAIPFAPYAIKPNVEELQELCGQRLETEAAIVQTAQDLLSKGIECVVVSMGAQGAIFAEANAIVVARPPKIEVVSTVGAGDAMVSGLIMGKLRGFSLSDCARLATAFSMGALSQVGPRLPPQEAIESLMQEVRVETL
ncbi:MAG: 1-phosphofructokinase [Drouetiella hepatica Uher 2000/2452]|jgi:1-phosphofructokinase|uniref:1-phosphofructokinase n=1 Tax=Drouetiella hepatica Uher 2000/2452 TaxID=904376 RepID=A0A951UNS0_9CYAN|nr:1-phosphofructokinase [Drouetiella hepatica Uher 2000/2452]